MDTFDPENELIDQYLRGELTGARLDAFRHQLEQDPELKKDIEFRQMLVRGIQEHGAIQLKNYLRSRTTQKRVMRISYKAWTYAAAAVALLLVCSTVVVWMGQRHGAGVIETTIASENKPEDKGIAKEQHSNQDVNPEAPATSEKNADIKTPAMADGNGNASAQDREPGIEAMPSSESPLVYPDVVVVASNIQVKPIHVESELDETTTMKSQPAGRIVRSSSSRKESAPDKLFSDSLQRDLDHIAKATNEDMEMAKFKLSFYNTKDAIPQLSLNKNTSTGTTEMMVYNLPYDNPIILNYENRYFLKAGTKYYEIDMKQTGKQNVSEVVDVQLLEALNK